MRALVTGAFGFAGSHLVEHLISQKDEVVAVCAPGEPKTNLSHLIDKISTVDADLQDIDACMETIENNKPDVIYHLAAISFVPMGEKDPARLFSINVGAAASLAKAAIAHRPDCRFVYISSSEVYGQVPQEQMPIDEKTPLRPATLYAHSKQFAETVLLDAAEKSGLSLSLLRPFNHIGPRQSANFAAPAFARQIALIEKGELEPVVHVGNLSAKRDLTDVRDIARAYAKAGAADIGRRPFNICRGRAVKIEDMLGRLVELSTAKVEVKVDPDKLRPVDVPTYLGDNSAFCKAAGWAPEIPISKSLQDLLDYWRKMV